MNNRERSTLSILGIDWILGGGKRASFHYPPLVVSIGYRHHVGAYVVTIRGHDYFSHKSASVCLDKMTALINAHYESLIPIYVDQAA